MNPVYVGCSKVTSANDTDFVIVVTPSSNYGNWTMDWGDGQMSSGASLNPPAFITHSYISVSGGVFADTFNFTFTSGGCTIDGIVISGYPVTANISVPGGLTQLTCAPGILTFINNSNGASGLPVMPGTVFTWDWGDGSPLEVFDETQTGDSIQHTYQRNTVNCVTQVDLTANNACNLSPSVNSQSPVLIYDIDDAAIAASATVLCYPDTVVNFANGSNFNCYAQGNTDQRYEWWNFGDYWGKGYDSIVNWRPSGAPLGTPAPNPIPIAFPGIGTYTVTMIDSNMCGQDPATIIIEIVPPPTADIGISDDTVCAGETVVFQNLSTGGADQFSWDFDKGAGFQATGGGNQNQVYNTPGSYTITLAIGISGSNCLDSVSIDLEVLPSPTAVITLDNQNDCDSLDVTFGENSTGTGTLVTWTWDFGNGQTSMTQNPGLQHYGMPGNYNAKLTVVNNFMCADSTVEVINVYQTPVPLFTPTNVCENEVAQFMDLSTHAVGDPIISWNWDFGDSSPNDMNQNPTHVYTNAGTYTLTLDIATANCLASDTTTIIVEQLPVAGFNADITAGCSPLTVNFTNTSSGNAAGFLWDFGDGDTTSQANPAHTFLNNSGADTTYTVRLIAFTAFGCSDTAYQTIDVYPNPTALFIDSSALIKCSPAVMRFINLSSNGAISYLWDFDGGNTSTGTNPLATFVNDSTIIDTVTVTLIAYSANNCTDTTSMDYIIFPRPSGLPNVIDTGCSPLAVSFPPTTGAVFYNWDFGDGFTTSGPTPSHTYGLPITNTTTYNVRLISTSAAGCKDTSFGNIVVHPQPVSHFLSSQNFGCQPLDVSFAAQSLRTDTYHWNFDDGITTDTTDSLISHTFLNPSDSSRSFQVQLVSETQFGCTDTAVNTIMVHPAVVASYTHDTVGCAPFSVVFTNNSSPAATVFNWDFGNGNTSSMREPANAYLNNTMLPDTFTVMLYANSVNNCADTATSTVVVYPSPNASINVNPTTKTYPDTVFNILNGNTNWSYFWELGNGSTTTDVIPGETAYTGWGDFTVKLKAMNAICEDSAQVELQILPPIPIVAFDSPAVGCAPLTVQFYNRSKYGHSFQWRFTHSTNLTSQSSIDENPVVTFTEPGEYNVTLKVTGEGGTDELTETDNYIQVYESPTASFIVRPVQVYVPNDPVICTNTSRGDGLSYHWDFGDGNFSNAVNPEHYYLNPGTYTISLRVNNERCEDFYESPTIIDAIPSGGVSAPNAFTPNTNGDPSPRGNGGATRSELFGTTNDAFWPVITGELKQYEFIVFNKWGEMLFRTEDREMGWTGYYRRELCQQDVYVYKVKAQTVDNKQIVLVGDITLLR